MTCANFLRLLLAPTVSSGTLLCLAIGAYGQVVLDDFTVSDESNYNFIPVSGGPPDGWTVAFGQLRPSVPVNGTAAWLWNRGEKLFAVGDSVSVTIYPDWNPTTQQGSTIGLFLAPSLSSNSGYVANVICVHSGFVNGVCVEGSCHIGGDTPGAIQLTVQMTAQTATNSSYQVISGFGSTPLTFTATAPSLYFGPLAGNTAGSAAALDNLTFNGSASGAVVIATPPISQFVQTGGSATFTVGASGQQPLTYQWEFGGNAFSGASGTSLSLNNVQITNAGNYSVVVSNAYGSVTSSVAQLIFLMATNRTPTSTEIGGSTIPSTATNLQVFVDGTFTNSAALNPNVMTVVLTHGWNATPNDWATNMAALLLANLSSPAPNIVAWDWSEDARSPWYDFYSVAARTPGEGYALGTNLLAALGQNYSMPIHFLGHSLGTLVNAWAADYLHGDAPGAPPMKTASAFLPTNTQMTLFDEAGIPSDPRNFWLLIVSLRNTLWADLGEQPAPAVPFYLKPLPKRAAWIDNYISAVGIVHPSAANVILTNLTADARDFYGAPNFATWWTAAKGFHAYPCTWYDLSIENPGASSMGNQWSFERNDLSSPPAAGSVFIQSITSSELNLTSMNTLTAYELLLERTLKEAAALVGSGEATIVGDVVQAFGQVTGRLAAAGSFMINLVTGSAGGPMTPQIGPHPLDNGPRGTNTPAYVWIPVAVPSNAISMSFDFVFQGNGNGDLFEVALGGTNLLTLETALIQTNVILNSGQFNVSSYAGQEAELFLGIIGGTSSNAMITISNISCYLATPPLVQAQIVAPSVVITWPLSVTNYVLEATDSLVTSDSWTGVTNAPAIINLQNTVIENLTSGNRFYRLHRK